jgi:hypothetical protein
MKAINFSIGALAMLLATAGSAQAGLLGVTQTFPDATLSSAYLIYDSNGINANTGLLRVVANATTLNEGAAAGNSTLTQSYLGPGDSTPNVILDIWVANGSGSLTAGSFVGGAMSIGFGTSPANVSKFSWQGAMTGFGFQADGKAFDATWTMGADQYLNMPATLSQFTNGSFVGGLGGIKINNSVGFTTQTFANDWVYGTSAATSALINSYLGGLTTPKKVNSTVLVDAFVAQPVPVVPVPEPETILLMIIGLAAIVPFARRRTGSNDILA